MDVYAGSQPSCCGATHRQEQKSASDMAGHAEEQVQRVCRFAAAYRVSARLSVPGLARSDGLCAVSEFHRLDQLEVDAHQSPPARFERAVQLDGHSSSCANTEDVRLRLAGHH